MTQKSFSAIVIEILKNNIGKSFTARSIAQIIYDKEADFCRQKMKNTKANTPELLITQLASELGAIYPRLQVKNISRTADSPMEYYYIDNTEKNNYNTCICNDKTNKQNIKPEHKLYPIFSEYCKKFLKIEVTRIDELKSKRKPKGKNEWKHPDFTGYKDLVANFEKNTRDLMTEYSNEKILLYSFEIKDGKINLENLRESFFQTVSNSSWANYSYLVSEGVDEDAADELRLLCASFKIGFIRLNKEDIEKSYTAIPAIKTDIDWNMIDRLSKLENPDFNKYIEHLILTYRHHKDNLIPAPTFYN